MNETDHDDYDECATDLEERFDAAIAEADADPYAESLIEMRFAEIGTEYMQVLSQLDALRAEERALNARRSAIEADLKRRMDAEGVRALALPGVHVRIETLDVVRVDPDYWQDVFEKLVADGKTHLLYRQLASKKLTEAVDAGYRLPDHVTLESIEKVRHRRSG